MSQVVHPEPQSLAMKLDDAGTAGPHHFHRGPIKEPHLLKPMDHVELAPHLPHTPRLAGPQARQRNQI